MRYLFLLLFALAVLSPVAAAQDAPLVEAEIDTPPQLIGGLAGLMETIRYPEAARAAGEQGTVFVQFIVDAAGMPTQVAIVRGVSEALDAEALRAVREARFSPPSHAGQPVRVRFTLPVRFVLPSDD